MTLRTLLCEDEPVARLHLRELVDATPGLALAGEAADGDAALQRIDTLRPDLVFMDIQMPGLNGLEVLRRARHQPAVVFTTAYDRHAVEAFDLGAADYLLKPFGAERFAKAVARVLARAESARAAPRTPPKAAEFATHVVVRQGGRLLPVSVDAISHLVADDDLVQVYVAGRALALSEPLGTLLDRLDARRFVRVHRSYAINLDHVAALEPRDASRVRIRLRDGSIVPASRAGTKALRARLNGAAG
jgi:two-component system LytT family response regulator